MAHPSGYAAEHPYRSHSNQWNAHTFDIVGQECWVFERMCCIRAEKSSAVRAELFDGFHGGYRSPGDGLHCSFERVGCGCSFECHGYSSKYEQKSYHS